MPRRRADRRSRSIASPQQVENDLDRDAASAASLSASQSFRASPAKLGMLGADTDAAASSPSHADAAPAARNLSAHLAAPNSSFGGDLSPNDSGAFTAVPSEDGFNNGTQRSSRDSSARVAGSPEPNRPTPSDDGDSPVEGSSAAPPIDDAQPADDSDTTVPELRVVAGSPLQSPCSPQPPASTCDGTREAPCAKSVPLHATDTGAGSSSDGDTVVVIPSPGGESPAAPSCTTPPPPPPPTDDTAAHAAPATVVLEAEGTAAAAGAVPGPSPPAPVAAVGDAPGDDTPPTVPRMTRAQRDADDEADDSAAVDVAATAGPDASAALVLPSPVRRRASDCAAGGAAPAVQQDSYTPSRAAVARGDGDDAPWWLPVVVIAGVVVFVSRCV